MHLNHKEGMNHSQQLSKATTVPLTCLAMGLTRSPRSSQMAPGYWATADTTTPRQTKVLASVPRTQFGPTLKIRHLHQHSHASQGPPWFNDMVMLNNNKGLTSADKEI